MWTVARILLCILFAVLAAQAQDTPKVEIFGGYSYARFDPGTPSGVLAPGINLNGWNASLAGNLNDWFGIVGDFSGHYGSTAIVSVDVDTRVHSFLFGPRFSYRKNARLTPFGHALFGAAKLHGSANTLLTDRQSGFAMALGGGLDARLNDRVAIRLIQADYVLTRFKEASIACIANPLLPPCPLPERANQHSARLSFGVVFRLGQR